MATHISIKIKDDGIIVSASQDGEKVDMNDYKNINNVAGILAKVCTRMIGYSNKKKNKVAYES